MKKTKANSFNQSFDYLKDKIQEAVTGTYEDGLQAVDCTVSLGSIETPDGRKAQIQIKVTTDDYEWIGE